MGSDLLHTVKQRLIYFVNYTKTSQRQFEMKCGLSNGYINNIRVSIQPDKIKSISLCYPELNTGWLLTGEGEMLKDDTSKTKHDSGVSEMPDSHTETIPMIPFDVVAGYAGVDNAGVDISAYERYAIPEFKTIGAEFLIRVSGNTRR